MNLWLFVGAMACGQASVAVRDLDRAVQELQAERDAHRRMRSELSEAADPSVVSPLRRDAEAARQQIDELIKQLIARRAGVTNRPPASRSEPSTSPSFSGTGKPVDSLALGRVLLRAGDAKGALKALRDVETARLSTRNQHLVRYLEATCLRSLGQMDEAEKLYRELGALRSEPEIAHAARWQADAIQWRREAAAQVDEVRKRLKAAQEAAPSPPSS